MPCFSFPDWTPITPVTELRSTPPYLNVQLIQRHMTEACDDLRSLCPEELTYGWNRAAEEWLFVANLRFQHHQPR